MDAVYNRTYEFEGFVLDASRRVLRSADCAIELRPKSFDVLYCLVVNAGRLVTKDEILRTVWPGVDASDESLTRCVSDIRHALTDREQHIIKTVPGRGYVLAAPVAQPSANTWQGAVGTLPQTPVKAPSFRPSIAVLPFASMSMDADQEFFADGLTEDITTALCGLNGFFVIAPNTMFTYKGRAMDVRAIGRELEVRYLLEGSVRKAGDRIRVTAQLLEADTGNHIWAERYDRQLEDIFTIQDEITTSIVGRIGPELLVAEYGRGSRKPTSSLDAWECVVRALFHSSQQSEEGSRIAITLLDSALKADPDYAQALGMKAWIKVFRAFQGWEDMGEVPGAVDALIARALAVNNSELWPYLAQGMVGYATRNNELSVSALTRAVALSPSSVNAHGHLGIAHAFGGRSTEAVACIDYAVRLSPRDTFLSDFELYYAFAHFQGGRYDLALQFAQQAHRTRPGHPYPMVLGAACAGHLGKSGAAAVLLLELKTALPIVSTCFVEKTSPYVLVEDRARLIEGLQRAGLR